MGGLGEGFSIWLSWLGQKLGKLSVIDPVPAILGLITTGVVRLSGMAAADGEWTSC